MKSIVIAALLTQATATPVPQPMMPTGKWNVDYGQNTCVLSHDFGDATAPSTLAIAPSPLGEQSDVTLIAPEFGKGDRHGKATIMIDPEHGSFDADFVRIQLPKDKRPGARFRMTGDATVLFANATTMTVTWPTASMSFTLTLIKPALGALRTCQDDLLRGWGLDPHEREIRPDRKSVDLTVVAQRVGPGDSITDAPPAVVGNDPAGWVTSDDYPVEALAGEKQGSVTMLWGIGAEGRVQDCRVLASSGTPALDQASCRAIAKRARYIAVKDKTGDSVITHALGRVTWQLPR